MPWAFNLSATLRKCSVALVSSLRSMPVSYSVPCRVAIRLSVAGWEVPLARGDSAVSTMSTPASMAFMLTMSPVPVVLWVCRCTRVSGFKACFNFFTRL